MKNETNLKLINTLTYNGHTFEVFRIYSDNPGIDGYLTVKNAPSEFGVNFGYFFTEKSILDTIEENLELLSQKWKQDFTFQESVAIDGSKFDIYTDGTDFTIFNTPYLEEIIFSSKKELISYVKEYLDYNKEHFISDDEKEHYEDYDFLFNLLVGPIN